MKDLQLQLKKVSDGRTWALNGELLVGRELPAEVLLTEGHCSRSHARLCANADGVTIEDLRSRNGTYVNGLRIGSRVWLKCGDKVRFDTEEFVIDELVDPNATKLRPNDSQRAVIEPAHKDAPSSSASRQRPGAKIVEPQSRTFQIPAGDLLKHLPQPKFPSGPSAPDGVACLRVTNGASAGLEIPLTRNSDDKKRWSVGSDSDRDVRLTDSGVSGLHASIVNEGEKWKVIDEMSTNGTLVNSKRSPMSYLRTGDVLQFGSVVCLLQLPRGGREGAGRIGASASRRRTVWLAVAMSFVAILVLLYMINRILG